MTAFLNSKAFYILSRLLICLGLFVFALWAIKFYVESGILIRDMGTHIETRNWIGIGLAGTIVAPLLIWDTLFRMARHLSPDQLN